MAAYKNLGKELECCICLEYPTVPKVMGECLHAACLHCLEQLVATTRASKFFPCPLCNNKCNIPKQGVAAFKTDFRLQAIVEEIQKLEKEKASFHCIACSEPASRVCKDCENSYLCLACSGKHSQHPLTAAHELVGICSNHGKSLILFCRTCGKAICSACLFACNPTGGQKHDVVRHQKIANEEVAEVAAVVEKLKTTRRQKENALYNIIRKQDSVVATIDFDLSLLGKQSDSAIEKAVRERSDLKAELGNVQEQIDVLMKRKEELNKAIIGKENKITSFRQKNKEYSDDLNMNRKAFVEKFEEAVTQAVAETKEIKAKIDQGQKEISLKRAFDDQTVPILLKIKEELVQTLTTAEQVDRAAQFVDTETKLPRFVPASSEMEIGFIRREFTTLKKSADFPFSVDRPCHEVLSLRHLPDGRLASLYRSWGSGTDTIKLLDPRDPAVWPVEKVENIVGAVAMTVTSKSELMVLRSAKPAVRIFNNDDFHDVDIIVQAGRNLCRWSTIECDDEDNIFVVGRADDPFDPGVLRVFTPDGVIITDVKARFGTRHPVMSYCRLTRILYIADVSAIFKYCWDGTSLKEMPSIVHDLDGFRCTDICIGDGGEVFIAGRLPVRSGDDSDDDDEVRIVILQVVEAEEKGSKVEAKKEHATTSTNNDEPSDRNTGSSQDEYERTKFNVIKLNFDDEDMRSYQLGDCYYARISIFGNTLALGYHDKLELFDLLP